MSPSNPRLERRLRLAGLLIIMGLLVELLSLWRIHPFAFLAFMFLGGGFLLGGFAVYLHALISMSTGQPAGDQS